MSFEGQKKDEITQKYKLQQNKLFKAQSKQDNILDKKTVKTKIKDLKEYISTLKTQYQQKKQKNALISEQQLQSDQKQQNLYKFCSKFQSQQNTKHLLQKLKNANIIILEQNIVDFEILSIKQSLNCEAVQLKVQLNKFELNINILNISNQNIIQNELEVYKFGGFGKIYLCQHNETSYAIKKIQYNKENFQNINIVTDDKDCFFQIIKEFCFAKIFSALEIGPKLKNICGFDLIMNYGFVYFSMQICQNVFQFKQEDLKILLKTMHSLKIIDRDIKFSNIMFSPSYNKNVFIDFGGCIFIQEFLGFQTKTQFYGTLKYCSQQMKQLNKNEDFIDLYYNDLYALKIMFSEMKSFLESKSSKVQNQKEINIIQNIAEIKLDYIYCKSLIWTNNFCMFYRFINEKNLKINDLFQEEILNFMSSITPSLDLIRFYHAQITNQTKSTSIFSYLNSFYSLNFSGTYQYPSNKKGQFQYFSQFYLKLSQKFERKQVHKKKALCLSKYRQKISHEIYENLLINKENIKKTPMCQYLQHFLNYISLTENFYDKDIHKRIKINISSDGEVLCDVWDDKTILILAKSFIYLLKIITNLFEKENKLPFYLKILENLFILGVKLTDIQHYFDSQIFIKSLSSQDQFLQFWKFQVLIDSYEFNVLSSNYLPSKIEQSLQNIHIFYSNRQILFQPLNQNNLYLKLALTIKDMKNGDVRENFQAIWSQIKKRQNFPRLKQIQYIQFVFSIVSFIKFYLTKICLKGVFQISYIILQLFSMHHIPTYKCKQIPIYFTALIMEHSQFKNYSKIKKLLQYYDKIINIQDISIRYLIHQRLSLAFLAGDIKIINKIVSIICTLQAQPFFSFYNIFEKMIFKIQQNLFIYNNSQKIYRTSIFKVFQSLFMKFNKAVQNVESKIIQIYIKTQNLKQFTNISNYQTIPQLIYLFEILTFYFVAHKMLMINENRLNSNFFQQRVLFFLQMSRKMLVHPRKFAFYIQIYINIVRQIYSQKQKIKQFSIALNILTQLRPQMKSNRIIQRFKSLKFIQKSETELFINIFFVNLRQSSIDQYQNYRQLLIFYLQLVSHNQLNICYIYLNLLINIWKGHIICYTTYQNKFNFIEVNVNYLRINYRTVFSKFNHNFSIMFEFQNIEDYNSQKLISDYLLPVLKNNIKNKTQCCNQIEYNYGEQFNPYWAIICYYVLKSQKKIQISSKQIQIIIKFISFNINRLNINVRQLILQDFYQIIDISRQSNRQSIYKRINFRKCKKMQQKKRLNKIFNKNKIVYKLIFSKLQKIKQNNTDL